MTDRGYRTKAQAVLVSMLVVLSVVAAGGAAGFAVADDPFIHITVTKTVSNGTVSNADHVTVERGKTVTFAVEVLNDGTSNASVTIEDSMPDGLVYESSSPSAGSYDPQSGEWIFDVDPGDSQSLTVTARAEGTGQIVNEALAIRVDPSHDGEVASLFDAASVTVLGAPDAADLSVVKTVDASPVSPGDPITFTVDVTNDGPDMATGVEVTDQLPTGLVHVSSSTSQGSYDPGTGIWTVGSLDMGATATLTLVANGTTPGTYENVATISATDLPDGTPGDDSDSSTVVIEAGPVPPGTADLEIVKLASPNATVLGEEVTFEITVRNLGPNATSNVTVLDPLPSGLDFVSATPGGLYDAATGVWSVGDLADGEQQTLSVVANATSVGTLENVVTVATSDLSDADLTNNEARVSVTISAVPGEPAADLAITKTATPSTVPVGEHVVFSLTIANNGPNATANVSVTDRLPAAFAFVSSSSADYDSTTGLWHVGSLAAGATEVLELEVNATATGTWDNVANISSSDLIDPAPGNDESTDSVTVSTGPVGPTADLAIMKGATLTPVEVGDHLNFTITVTNNGPNATANVSVTDRLPDGLDFVGASSPNYNVTTGIWDVGALVAGASATLSLTVNATRAGSVENVANVSASDLPDHDSSNDEAAVQIDVLQPPTRTADLAITKVVTNATTTGDQVTAPPGTGVRFTVTVWNLGPDSASGIEIADPVGGLVNVTNSTLTGTYAAGVWSIDTLASGSSAVLTITGDVSRSLAPGDSIENRASVSGSDEYNPTGNDVATATVVIVTRPVPGPEADLVVEKTASTDTAQVGDEIRFTVTVRNDGPNETTGVRAIDTLSAGLQYEAHAASHGTYDLDGNWSIGGLAAGETATLELNATVTASGTQSNTVGIVETDVPDPNPDDNAKTVLVQVGPGPIVAADLAISKAVPPGTWYVGDLVTFDLTVTNHGPDNATDVVVSDQLPTGFTYVSATASGSYDAGTHTVTWDIGTLQDGARVTRQLTVAATASGTHENRASIGSTVTDPTTSNNVGTAVVHVRALPAGLDLYRPSTETTMEPGASFEYQLFVVNYGPGAASTVVLTDTLTVPSSWPVSVRTSTGTASVSRQQPGQTHIEWPMGDLQPNDYGVLTITIEVPESAPHETVVPNRAEVRWPYESQPQIDDLAEDLRVKREHDLSVTKHADPWTVPPGDRVAFTVEVSNNGRDTAYGVVVDDHLSPHLTPVPGGSTASQGTYSSGTWSVGTVAPGQTESLRIEAVVSSRAQAGLGLSNPVFVEPGWFQMWNPDPDMSNNYWDAILTVLDGEADLAIEKTVSNATTTGDDVSAFVGENVTYTITVRNTDPTTAAEQVLVVDSPANLPPGGEWDFVQTSHTATRGVWDWTGTAGYWTIGRLPGGETATVTVTGYYESVPETVTPPRTLQNMAEVSSAADPDTSNDRATAAVSLWDGRADLGVTKTVQSVWLVRGQELARSAPARNVTTTPGAPVVFTVNVTNTGPDNATNVVLTDTLPDGLTFLDLGFLQLFGTRGLPFDALQEHTSHGTFDAERGEWRIGLLPAGERATLRFTAFTDEPGVWPNLAEVTSTHQYDANRANNVAVATVEVVAQPPDAITISKTVANETVSGVDGVRAAPAENVTYTITVRNTGTLSASVLVADPILGALTDTEQNPFGTEPLFVETGNTTTQGQWHANITSDPSLVYNGIWSVGSLDPGANATLTVTGHFTELAVALFSGQSLGNGDRQSLRNDAFVITTRGDYSSDSASVTLGADADLVLEKRVSNATVTGAPWVISGTGPGQPVVYTLTLKNDGPEDTPIAFVIDPFLGEGQPWEPLGASLAADSTGTRDRIWIETANATTQGIWPSDFFEPALPDFGVWEVGPLANNSSATLTVYGYFNEEIGVDLTRPVTIENLALAMGTADPDPTTNRAQAAVVLYPIADVGVEKTVSNGTTTGDHVFAALDQAVTYNITVTADRPGIGPIVVEDPVLGVLLAAPGPSFVVDNQTTAGTWTEPADTSGEWYVTLPENETAATLSVTGSFAVEPADTVRNTVTVEAPFHLDRNPDNDADEASVTVRRVADLSLDKHLTSAGPIFYQQPGTLTVTPGETIRYTLVVRNDGPNAATDVVVSEYLPGSLSLVGPAVASRGTYYHGNGSWIIGTLPVGETAGLELDLLVTATQNTTIRNMAQVAESGAFDPDSVPGNKLPFEDDQAAAEVDVRVGPTPPPNVTADLEIAKTVDRPSVRSGEFVQFTVAVTNTGPGNATGVVVGDSLPARLEYVVAWWSQGDYDARSGRWSVGRVANGTTHELRVLARATSDRNTTVLNLAEIVHSDVVDPDSVPGNARDGEDDVANATVDIVVSPLPPIPVADLAVQKSANVSSMQAGDAVTFTVTVSNDGPDDVSGVVLQEYLPARATLLDANASQGSYETLSQTWTVGTVAAGHNASLALTARVNATRPTAIRNVVEVAAALAFDPDSWPGNNLDTEDDWAAVTVNVSAAPGPVPSGLDLELAKTVNRSTVESGGVVEYTISVTNTGPSNVTAAVADPRATGVTVVDRLPGMVSLLAATPEAAYNRTTGIWNVSTLDPGQTETLTLLARVYGPEGTVVRNAAEVASSDETDPDSTPGNWLVEEDDYDVADVVIGPSADLELEKRADRSSVRQGGRLTYTLDVTNLGPGNATGVVVTDRLPAGIETVLITTELVRIGSGFETFVWSVGAVPAGSTRTLTVTVTATASPGTDLLNVAEITASDVHDPDSTPGNDASGEDDRDTVSVPVRSTPTPPPPDDDDEAFVASTGGSGKTDIWILSAGLNRTEITVGDTVQINGTLKNQGAARGDVTVRPRTNDSWLSPRTVLNLGMLETKTVTFNVTIEETGTHHIWLRNIERGRNVSAGTLTVSPVVTTTTPTPTPTPTATPTPTTTATPTPMPTTTTTTPAPVEEPAGFNPLWLLVLLAAGLVVLGIREYSRRQGGV